MYPDDEPDVKSNPHELSELLNAQEDSVLDDAIPQRWRAYLYRVGTAAVPILTGYGVVSESKAALWLGLLGALLAVGIGTLAASHTRTNR